MGSSCIAKIDRRFPQQQISQVQWLKATAVNAAADYIAGFEEVVEQFLCNRQDWQGFRSMLHSASRAEIAAYVEENRQHSLAFIALMLTGACNADCAICFTDRRRKKHELKPEERRQVLRQAKQLGAQFVYVPGEGEPTIDEGWWSFLEACGELDLPALVFTNGMIFGDKEVCQRYWGMTPEQAVARLRAYPVSFYVKYWSADARLAAQMLAVAPQRLPYEQLDGIAVPRGLAVLLNGLPRERMGVEVVIERRNADEVAEVIAPFTDRHGLARIIEMLQHNGRTLGDPSYDPTPEQLERCEPLLSPTSCNLGTCKAVVTVQGFLSPRIAVLEHQLPPERRRVQEGPLFDLLHSTPYIVERRYRLDCLCELLPLEFAQNAGKAEVAAPLRNVSAPALASVIEHTVSGAAEEARAARLQQRGCASCSGNCGCHH